MCTESGHCVAGRVRERGREFRVRLCAVAANVLVSGTGRWPVCRGGKFSRSPSFPLIVHLGQRPGSIVRYKHDGFHTENTLARPVLEFNQWDSGLARALVVQNRPLPAQFLQPKRLGWLP